MLEFLKEYLGGMRTQSFIGIIRGLHTDFKTRVNGTFFGLSGSLFEPVSMGKKILAQLTVLLLEIPIFPVVFPVVALTYTGIRLYSGCATIVSRVASLFSSEKKNVEESKREDSVNSGSSAEIARQLGGANASEVGVDNDNRVFNAPDPLDVKTTHGVHPEKGNKLVPVPIASSPADGQRNEAEDSSTSAESCRPESP